MAKQREKTKHELYPNRYKKVTLSFTEPELWGLYTFFVSKVQMSSFKKEVTDAGGSLEKETNSAVYYSFEGEGAVLKVHNLAEPYMYKY